MLAWAWETAAWLAGWQDAQPSPEVADRARLNDSSKQPGSSGGGAAATAGAPRRAAPPLPATNPHVADIAALQAQPPPLLLPPAAPVLPPAPLGSMKEDFWVTSVPLLAGCAMELYEVDRVALDVEHHAQHSYAGMTCLIQLSTGTRDFLIDCLALPRDEVQRLLAPVLSNPRICKVVHGGGNDVAWLQRDFGLLLVNVFDTEKACQVLGFHQRSLGVLLQRYCGITIDKSVGQRADWRQRPLPPELVEYARRDVRHLLFIADCLGQLLVEGAGPAAPAHVAPQPPGQQQQQQPGAQQPGEQQQPPQRSQQQRAAPPEERLPAFAPTAAAPAHPAVVSLSPAARQALEAAMAAPHSRLRRAVHRSQALTLQLFQPLSPAAAVAAAAGGIMRRAVAAALEGHARLTEQQVAKLETLGDCVHVLAGWRDAAARDADEGLQCLLPDAALLALASAAAGSVAPEAGNMRGRQQGISQAQLLELLHMLPGPEATCGLYPAALRRDVRAVAATLSEAAAGQRPWVSAELQEALAAAAEGMRGGGSNKAHKRRDPEAFRQRLAERFSCKSIVYENCQLYSRDGELLCHTDRRKIEWYIKKGLAEKTCDDPLCACLNFQHKTTDQQQGTSAFYTVHKHNRCVACGEEGHYLRYRVVPCCYRKAMPVSLKSHRSHDVVLLCVSCHELAQQAAEKLKAQLATEHGVPLLPPRPLSVPWPPAARGQRALQAGGGDGEASAADAAAAAAASKLDLHPHNVRRSALALQRYAASMPAPKRRQLEAQVRAYLALQGSWDEAGSGAVASGVAGGSGTVAVGGSAAGEAASEEPAAEGTSAAPAADGQGEEAASCEGGLTPLELCSGLLAGLARRTRRRTLLRWVKQGQQLPPELAAEVGDAEAAGSDGAGATNGAADEDGGMAGEAAQDGQAAAARQHAAADAGARNTGHAWHGQQVVERVLAAGGEDGLLDLCRRFRECFVETLQPQFLPAGWAVHHWARREFGEHSIYRDGGSGGSPRAGGRPRAGGSPAASSPPQAACGP